MNKSPWYSNERLILIRQLLRSYYDIYGEELIQASTVSGSDIEIGQKLFLMQNPVMAHNQDQDPCLNYVNAAALKLWGNYWGEMIGMPSKLTAPEEEREKREHSLKQVNGRTSIENYKGVRVNSSGEYFIIDKARIWSILNEKGEVCGQAATFNAWWKI